MFWTIVVIGIIFFIILGAYGTKQQEKASAKLVSMGYALESKIETGKYIAGHPDINDPILKTSIYPIDNRLEILFDAPFEQPVEKGSIFNDSIKNILVEDRSTIEKRVTATRLVLLGVLALVFRKKEKNELSYLTIEWNDGKFDHETIFEFEGTGATQTAYYYRNNILNVFSDSFSFAVV